MNEISDLYDDLAAIKAATDDEGRLKAQIEEIDVQENVVNVHIRTDLGDEIVENFRSPDAWSDDYEFVKFIENGDLNVEILDTVDRLDIRYDTEDEAVICTGSSPDISRSELSEHTADLINLRDSTIRGNWIESDITQVEVDEDTTEVTVEVSNYGSASFVFETPSSWRDEYAIVQLCDSLNVNSAEGLASCSVAVRTGRRRFLDLSGSAFDDVSSESKFDLLPTEYVTSGEVPDSDSSSSGSSNNNSDSASNDNSSRKEPRVHSNSNSCEGGPSPLAPIVLMGAIVIGIGALAGAMLYDMNNMDKETEYTVSENDDELTIEITYLWSGKKIVVVENGVRTATVDDPSSVFRFDKSSNSSGTVKLIEVDKESGEKSVLEEFTY